MLAKSASNCFNTSARSILEIQSDIWEKKSQTASEFADEESSDMSTQNTPSKEAYSSQKWPGGNSERIDNHLSIRGSASKLHHEAEMVLDTLLTYKHPFHVI